jgi:hypothetical protein
VPVTQAVVGKHKIEAQYCQKENNATPKKENPEKKL